MTTPEITRLAKLPEPQILDKDLINQLRKITLTLAKCGREKSEKELFEAHLRASAHAMADLLIRAFHKDVMPLCEAFGEANDVSFASFLTSTIGATVSVTGEPRKELDAPKPVQLAAAGRFALSIMAGVDEEMKRLLTRWAEDFASANKS